MTEKSICVLIYPIKTRERNEEREERGEGREDKVYQVLMQMAQC